MDEPREDPAAARRRQRLEAQMKENLKRRKAQARARREADAAPPLSGSAASDDGTPASGG